jgi:hypothetical protein
MMARKRITNGESVVRVGISLDTKSLALYTSLCPENLSAGIRAGAAIIAATQDTGAARYDAIETARQTIITMLETYCDSYNSMARVARAEGRTQQADMYSTVAIDINRNMIEFVRKLP